MGASLVINIAWGFFLFYDGLFAQEAEAWDVQTAWRQTQCRVLAAGVSCTDTGIHVISSICDGYKAGAMPNQSVPVFLTEQIAVCPGTYWCAKEGNMCNCTGEITYSPMLFDGYVYTVPEAEQSYKVMSHGMWKCGTDQSGVQYKVDPAPWHPKHCFCTPSGIQEILRPYGAEHLHKKECSENVKFDFESPGRRLKEATHREPRQLHVMFRYTPWALVTVEDEDSLDEFRTNIRCAYEYGVPEASRYYGSEARDAENVALAWGKDPLRDCWVRTQSQSQSVDGGFCGLSMVISRTLQETARVELHGTRNFFYLCTIFNVLLYATVGYIFRKALKKCLKPIQKDCQRMLRALRRKFRSVCFSDSEESEEKNQNLIGT